MGIQAAPYHTHSNQRFPLGQVMELPDGRIYRYAENGAVALAAAKLCQTMALGANFDTLAIQAARAVGTTTIPFTTSGSTVAENQFADGTVVVEDVALNLGEIYPVKSNTSAADPATCTLTLHDGVTVLNALTTTGKVTVRVNPWKQVIVVPTVAPSQMVVGVPQVIVGISAYGWLQTHGVCNVVVDATVTAWVIGQGVRPSEDDAGGAAFLDFDEAAQADKGLIGFAIIAGTDLDFAPIFLRIE